MSKKIVLEIRGLHCASCVNNVEKVLGRLDYIENVSVSLTAEKIVAQVKNGTEEEIEGIIAAVKNAGFEAFSLEDEEREETQDLKSQRWRLYTALFFAVLVFYGSMGHMIGIPVPSFLVNGYVQLLFTIPVIIAGFSFYQRGIPALLKGHPNMDTLVSLGTMVAFLYSVYLLVYGHGHALYFESAAMILALIMLGRYLEAKAKVKTGDRIRRLLDLSPERATVIRDGREIEIPAKELKVDDLFIVKPGEKIPADGVVLSGASAVDESMLSGESIPVDKEKKDAVYGGSLNHNGVLNCIAIHDGKNTALTRIVKMVEEAASSKAPVARLADKIAGIFVPVVLFLALLAAVLWFLAGKDISFSLMIFISVLVISCPCALGLATPTAIMVGMGKGTEAGVIFKDAAALELANKITTVVFDKTGTLTKGTPTVTDILPTEGVDETTLLSLAGSLEKNSQHPLGKSIYQKAKEDGVSIDPIEEFYAHHGSGVVGKLHGEDVMAGNEKALKEQGISLGIWQSRVETLAKEGKTPIFFAKNREIQGIIALSDMIKPQAKKTVLQLQRMGITPVLLSGDKRETAEAIGGSIGISTIYAEVLPEEKVEVIATIQKQGGVVAMVGDGINDAPALTKADVGFVMAEGSDAAIACGDAVLMSGNPYGVCHGIHLSKATVRNIKGNLFWAFIYNILGIPVAAGVLYLFGGPLLNPMIAALAMSLSSISVVLNALRLNLFEFH